MNFTQSQPMSVTDEEGDLLYALVRMRKPLRCLETGTGRGVAARRIGEALARNGAGILTSCETDPEILLEAKKRVVDLPVFLERQRGVDFITDHRNIDFVFVDSGDPATRLEELKLLDDSRVSPGGIVAVHDVLNVDAYDDANHRPYDYSVLCQEMNGRGWPGLVFPSLVGIAIYRRPG